MKLSDYQSYTTSTAGAPYIPYAIPFIELPKIGKKIVKNFINDATLCCIDSRLEYKYPVLFYIAGKDGEGRSGTYLFAITAAGSMELFSSINIPGVEVVAGGNLIIDGVDLI
jgi:hypothetical protein